MPNLRGPILFVSVFAISPTIAGLAAQSVRSSDDESRQRPPAFASGIGVGAMQFSSGRSETAVSATLQYSPSAWLTLSATPGFGRTSRAGVSTSGLTDVPISAGASHALNDLPLSPSIFGSMYTTLSMSDSGSVLGVGQSTLGAAAALSAWMTDRVNLTVGASHPLSTGAGNGSIDLEGAYSLGATTATLGFTSEVGRADSSATLARSIATGAAFSILGPLTLTVDGSRGLTTGAPSWTLSVGLGTAFAGISPLNPSSPLRRLKRVFGSQVTATSGYGKTRSGSKTCKIAGTC
jgi:hypothetical protein